MISLKHKQLFFSFFFSSALIYVQPSTLGSSFGPGGARTKKLVEEDLTNLTTRGAAESPRQVLAAPAQEREGAGHPLAAAWEDGNLVNRQHCTNRTTNEHSLRTHADEVKKSSAPALPLLNRCDPISKVKKEPFSSHNLPEERPLTGKVGVCFS